MLAGGRGVRDLFWLFYYMYGNVISLNFHGSRDLDPRMTDLVSSRH